MYNESRVPVCRPHLAIDGNTGTLSVPLHSRILHHLQEMRVSLAYRCAIAFVDWVGRTRARSSQNMQLPQA